MADYYINVILDDAKKPRSLTPDWQTRSSTSAAKRLFRWR
jgi:hypothetical protein